MASEEVLRKTLKNADGKPFAKYKGITNNFVLEDFEIFFDDVQNDRSGHTDVRVRVPMRRAGFPEDTRKNASRTVALRDLIARRFWETSRAVARSPFPKMTGGEVFMPRPGQEIVERFSVVVTEFYVEARFNVNLPCDGGKVNATAAEALIFDRIASIVSESMLYSAYKPSKLYNHLETNENADYIRDKLKEKGLAAFIAEGSVLPRREDDLAPLVDAESFDVLSEYECSFEVPNGPPVRGFGIPAGVTMIAGHSRSGRSGLLDAILTGVYNHIPGDGREYVITRAGAAFVSSQPGRAVTAVDVSSFLPGARSFQTSSAHSAMSEYAEISESLEMGSDLLLMDDEYSHPSLFRRSPVDPGSDPVTVPEVAGSLAAQGVSLIISTNDASVFRFADRVLLMRDHRIVGTMSGGSEAPCTYTLPSDRYPVSRNVSYEKARKEVFTGVSAIRTFEIGEVKLEVPLVPIFDMAQARCLAEVLAAARNLMDGTRTLRDVCETAVREVYKTDFEEGRGMYHASVRPMDVAAVLNRHPSMLMIRKD